MDFNLLRAFCERKVMDRLYEQTPKSLLAPDTVAMIGWLQLYFATYPDSNEVNFETMNTLLDMRGQGANKP